MTGFIIGFSIVVFVIGVIKIVKHQKTKHKNNKEKEE